MVQIAPLADALLQGHIQRYVVQPPYVRNWVVPFNGAQVLLPVPDRLFPFLQSTVSPQGKAHTT